ncbi:hypothetical protein MUG78_09225 [Gordonia alkaliphila]|uniref:DUF4064 domain-containing protein n=1 Tax=Gordonia alkaliphila TaxID=1053547 RepID=A0ABP8YUY7_9ACTN|nr:magnesium transporter [Gordonia alkaliphila]MCK0439638.1 hypothetical protein [Gordonia alkaliphila]
MTYPDDRTPESSDPTPPVDPYAGTQIGNTALPGQPYDSQPDGTQSYGGPAPEAQQFGSEQFGGQPYAGQPYAAQPYPGQPYGSQQFGGQPFPGGAYPPAPQGPTSRPGSVVSAGAILIVLGALGLLGTLSSRLMDTGITVGDGAYVLGSIIGTIISLVIVVAALGAGIALLTQRSNNVRILATVIAALLAVTCIGLVATIAVPILLWATDSAKSWFADAPIGTPPAQY